MGWSRWWPPLWRTRWGTTLAWSMTTTPGVAAHRTGASWLPLAGKTHGWGRCSVWGMLYFVQRFLMIVVNPVLCTEFPDDFWSSWTFCKFLMIAVNPVLCTKYLDDGSSCALCKIFKIIVHPALSTKLLDDCDSLCSLNKIS